MDKGIQDCQLLLCDTNLQQQPFSTALCNNLFLEISKPQSVTTSIPVLGNTCITFTRVLGHRDLILKAPKPCLVERLMAVREKAKRQVRMKRKRGNHQWTQKKVIQMTKISTEKQALESDKRVKL